MNTEIPPMPCTFPHLWVVHIPAPDQFVNANQRLHFRRQREMARNWRYAGFAYARMNRLPKGLNKARIVADLHFGDQRKRDDHNYFGTVKAIIDGMVGDYGLLPGDDAAHLIGVELRRGEPVKRNRAGITGAVTLTVVEVTS